MKKTSHKNDVKKYVSIKRAHEIEDTFKALDIVNKESYLGANDFAKNFQRVSLYESHGVIYTTSGNTDR